MTESNIARLIRLVGGQVALQQALAKRGVHVTQQAISLWKTQGYAPENRHVVLAVIAELWCAATYSAPVAPIGIDELAHDIELAALNKSVGA